MKNWCYLLLLFLLPFSGFSQKSIEQMKAASMKAKKEIEYTNKLLKETEKTKNASVEKLNLLNQQITVRNNYVNSLTSEINGIEGDIVVSSYQVKTLEAQLRELQKEYNQTLFTLYKVRNSYDQLIFIFSADNYNQAYNRLKYLQYYTDYMIKQAERIRGMEDSILKRKSSLQTLVVKKQEVVVVHKQEAQKLSSDKHQESLIIQELSAKQQELKKKIDQKKALAKKLDRQVEDAIRAEIRAAQAAARAKADAEAKANAKANATTSSSTTAKKTTTPVKATETKAASTASPLTPAESIISKNFADNRGRLPWPTPNGRITERFGTHPHPTLPFDVESNGIEITTTKGTRARAIFEGTVTKIVMIPGKNTAVIIKHGNYYTVYDNLVNVTVKNGQKVSVKQDLGTIFTDPETGLTVLQLQIWKELLKLDPELWLSK